MCDALHSYCTERDATVVLCYIFKDPQTFYHRYKVRFIHTKQTETSLNRIGPFAVAVTSSDWRLGHDDDDDDERTRVLAACARERGRVTWQSNRRERVELRSDLEGGDWLDTTAEARGVEWVEFELR